MIRKLCGAMAIAIAVVALSACGGSSGGSSGGGGGPVDSPESQDLSQVTTLTEDDIIHFLRRTHFGLRPSELEAVQTQGYVAYVDAMLALPAQTSVENAATSAEITSTNFPSQTHLMRWWLHVMNRTANPFQEVLAMFWHDHFAASSDVMDLTAGHWLYDHMDMLRNQTMGKFADLLETMARDWLMLVWLDGVSSTVTAPNENFAREFWELFTLGADNGYTQQDIEEAARSFTGYRDVFASDYFGAGQHTRIVTWVPARHDNGTKTIFGQTVTGNGEQEYRDIIDLTLQHRGINSARFICRKLWEFFVYRNPSDALVENLAQGFVASDFELRPLYRRILLSKAFFSARAKEPLVKSVIEHHVGFMRTTGLMINSQQIDFSLRECAQEPLRPPTVNGWPKDRGWLSAHNLLERANFIRDCITLSTHPPQSGWDGAQLLVTSQDSDAEVVDRLAWLLQVTLEPSQQQLAIDYLNQDRNAGGVFSQPWDPTSGVQRDKKIRGLLYILALHSTYQTR